MTVFWICILVAHLYITFLPVPPADSLFNERLPGDKMACTWIEWKPVMVANKQDRNPI
jgi:hypothetical protein